MKPSLAVSLRNLRETLRICLPTALDASLSSVDGSVCDARLVAWSHRVLHNAGLTLELHGRENADPRLGPFVVMSNHQSHYDVPVLFAALGGRLRMVAKQELRNIPIFGKAAESAGMVFVDRGNHARAVESMNSAREKIKQGISVFVAPEGTRSHDGSLGTFKKGGFVIATQVGRPILPITIVGTLGVLRSGSFLTTPGGTIRVTIHPSVDPRAFSGDEREARAALMGAVHSAIGQAL
jgi:1-acyl-sn-glycerol-3-phosphate acyltransferase